MAAMQYRPLRGVSVPGTMAALVAVAAGSYILLVIGQGVGHHFGRIFISFLALSPSWQLPVRSVQ